MGASNNGVVSRPGEREGVDGSAGLEFLLAHQARDAKRQGEGNLSMIPLTLPLNVIKESETKMVLFGCVSQKHL